MRILVGLPSFLFSAIILFLLTFLPFVQLAAGKQCTPVAVLEGDLWVLDKIEPLLEKQGVALIPAENCPAVRVRVKGIEGKLSVLITDSFGRVSKRLVDDEKTAAAVIESWARSEIGLRWVEPRVTPKPDEPEGEPQGEPAPVRITTHGESATFFAAAETSWGVENSYWAGTSLGGRKGLGPVELGGRLRFASMFQGPQQFEQNRLKRYASDAMTTLDVSLLKQPFHLAPSIGGGIGWLRNEGEAMNPDGMTDASQREIFDTWGPIVQTGLAAGWDFPGALCLAMEASFRFYIPPQTRDFVRDERHLPGEPWGFVSLALHLMRQK